MTNTTKKIDSLSLAAILAKKLSNGCAPERTSFTSVNDLFDAMNEAAEAENARSHEQFRWAAPWQKSDTGTLCHQTTTNRMNIEVGNNFIRLDLFSPSFSNGEQPLFTLEVRDGALVKASVVESARSVVKEKLDRISHVGEYMIPLVGNDFFETTDAWTAQAVTKQLVGARTYTIDWCKDPENEGYYPEEYMSELLCNSEKDLVAYKAKLAELQSHDGALV